VCGPGKLIDCGLSSSLDSADQDIPNPANVYSPKVARVGERDMEKEELRTKERKK